MFQTYPRKHKFRDEFIFYTYIKLTILNKNKIK